MFRQIVPRLAAQHGLSKTNKNRMPTGMESERMSRELYFCLTWPEQDLVCQEVSWTGRISMQFLVYSLRAPSFRLHWCGMACEIFFFGPLFILFSSTYTMLTKLFLPEFHFFPVRAHIFCEAHTAILQRVLEYRLGNIFLAQAPSSKEKYYMVRVFFSQEAQQQPQRQL